MSKKRKTTRGRPPHAPGFAWNPNALRVRRAARRIPADKLGEALGLSGGTVLRWEMLAGGGSPTPEQAAKVAAQLGCDIEALGREPKIL